jgi:hypothetical protein
VLSLKEIRSHYAQERKKFLSKEKIVTSSWNNTPLLDTERGCFSSALLVISATALTRLLWLPIKTSFLPANWYHWLGLGSAPFASHMVPAETDAVAYWLTRVSWGDRSSGGSSHRCCWVKVVPRIQDNADSPWELRRRIIGAKSDDNLMLPTIINVIQPCLASSEHSFGPRDWTLFIVEMKRGRILVYLCQWQEAVQRYLFCWSWHQLPDYPENTTVPGFC